MKYVYTALVFFFIGQVQGQKLVSAESLITTNAGLLNLGFPQLNAVYNIQTYRVTYLTSDTEGVEHVASGIVNVPLSMDNLIFPLACYQHGTVAGRVDVPSNLMGGYQLAVAFASRGYVVVTPDYIGLGESPGVHPYVHAETEASAGVDLLLAAQEMIEGMDGIALNDQLFITGYSQGGHAAMALQQEIELNQTDLFTVTASAPMSGPYSVSREMVDFTLGEDEYFTVGYLAWLTLGYQRAYPDDFADFPVDRVFRPEYVDDILRFRDEDINLWELNEIMINTLQSTVGTVTPRNTLQDDILDALFNDPDHPMSIALADNDTYDWVTETPTNMYYCVGDDQVTYRNAIRAEEMMTLNGSPNVAAVRMDTDDNLLDHGGCVFPASFAALDFFDEFMDITSSTHSLVPSEHISVWQEGNSVWVDMDEPGLSSARMDFYDANGLLLQTSQATQGRSLHEMPAGPGQMLYVIIWTDKRTLNTTKVIRH